MRSLTVILLVVACGGGGATTTDDGGSTGPGATTTGPGPTTSGTTDASTSSTGPQATSSPDGTATSSEGTSSPGSSATSADGSTSAGATDTGDMTDTGDTTGGTSPLVIAVVDAELHADCTPNGGPDPVWGQWWVDFDNTANSEDTSAVLVAASLSLAGGDVVEAIAVSPTESGPVAAGAYESLEFEKLAGAMHSACAHCGEFYELALDWDEGGVIHHVVEDVTVPCDL